MEYVQERVATLHDFGDAAPSAPTDHTTVVVPMTGREHGSPAAEHTLSTLARVDPAQVIVALRTDAGTVADVVDWLDGFDLDPTVVWCTAPAVATVLDEAGLSGPPGKGRDVWLGLGCALDTDYVVVHDADATSYDRTHVPRLAFPLSRGYDFVKGYYARVEHDRLYGRLCRLLVVPLVRTLAARHDAPVLEYLDAFRYPLAGEFAATTDLARHVRAQRGWGLEVGTLGEAFEHVGFADSAQVDLGVHEHDHREVAGPEGLETMSRAVAAALFRVLEDTGVDLDYDALGPAYRQTADRLVDQYAADAAFNGLAFDRATERDQVRAYAEAIRPPGPDDRLPAWADAPIDPEAVRAASREALAAATER